MCACGVFDFLKDLTEIVNFIISDEQTFGLYPFSFIIFIIILIIDLCNYFLHKSCEPHIFVLFPCRVVFYCLEYIYGKKVILFG